MVISFEEGLGVQIFKRSSVGVELTEEGKILIPKFEAFLSAENDIYESVNMITEGKKYELKIGTYSSISRSFLTNILMGFKSENPNVKFSVNVMDDLRGWLDDGRADIIFADERVVSNSEWVPIMDDIYDVIAPKNYFGDRRLISRDELYNHPHLFSYDYSFIDGYFDASKFKEVTYIHSEDDLSIINMVKNGMGIAVLPRLVLKENKRGISVLRLEPQIKRSIGFAYKKHRGNSTVLGKFLKYIKVNFGK